MYNHKNILTKTFFICTYVRCLSIILICTFGSTYINLAKYTYNEGFAQSTADLAHTFALHHQIKHCFLLYNYRSQLFQMGILFPMMVQYDRKTLVSCLLPVQEGHKLYLNKIKKILIELFSWWSVFKDLITRVKLI